VTTEPEEGGPPPPPTRAAPAPSGESLPPGHLAPSPREGFEGKIALITGASRGIGRALALRLAARGATSIINYRRNEDAAADTVAEIGSLGATGLAIRADLESVEQIEAMFDQVSEQFGRLDFFVSNASASNFRPLMELKPHHLERTFNTNVRAFVIGTQRAAQLMDQGGRIVVMSSYGSVRVFPTYANLGSNKAALEMWARYMAVELAPRGINVNAVNPGIIKSDSSSFFYETGLVAPLDTVVPKIPKQRLGSVQEAADCVLFLLSPASEYVTGTTLVVDGGLTAVSPPFESDLPGGN
jgi:enoyl-[acyl-carrier protein] reductase III